MGWTVLALGCVLADEVDDQIQQAIRAGAASYVKADYDAASIAYEKAWELAQQTPAANPARYEVLKRLTSVRAAAGDFAHADAYLQLAINWRETVIGRDDPKIADDLLVSAAICRGMNDLDRALAILERVRFMHVRSAGTDSVAVASDLSLIAQVYLDQKKPESAVESWFAAVKIREKVVGHYDGSLVGDLDRLGQTLITLQRYAEAEDAFRHALVIRESILGRNSADLIPSIDGLAYACFGQKKYEAAEPLYHRLIALWTTYVGNEHPMVAMAYDKVAVFYADQKKFEQAKAAADQGNAIRAHFLATGLVHEATELLPAGNLEAVKSLYRRALGVLDPPHPVYAELRTAVESTLKSMDKPAVKPKYKTAGKGLSDHKQ